MEYILIFTLAVIEFFNLLAKHVCVQMIDQSFAQFSELVTRSSLNKVEQGETKMSIPASITLCKLTFLQLANIIMVIKSKKWLLTFLYAATDHNKYVSEHSI